MWEKLEENMKNVRQKFRENKKKFKAKLSNIISHCIAAGKCAQYTYSSYRISIVSHCVRVMCFWLHTGNSSLLYFAWFTFSSRQQEMIRERECEEYIRLVCHILNLLLSHLEALWNMSVNQSRVKGNENVLPRYRRYCDYILVQFLIIDCGLKLSEK